MTTSDVVRYVSDKDPCKVKTQVPVDPNDPTKGTKEHVTISEGATVFFLKPLDVFLTGYIYDNASTLSGKQGDDTVGIHTRINQTNIDAVQHGLAGFENFSDNKGNSNPFTTVKKVVAGREYEVAADDVLKRLGIRLVQELAEEIKRISEVAPAEEKH